MTRRTVALLFAAMILLAASAAPGWAQRGEDTRPVRIYVDLGYVNLFSYPKWFNLGPELEIRLGRLFTLNPDISVWIGQSFARKAKIVPGATLNLRLGRFFVGGGAVRRVSDWPENESDAEIHRGWLLPKAQVGYLAGPTRLTFSILLVQARNDVAFGLTIGMGLGRPARD